MTDHTSTHTTDDTSTHTTDDTSVTHGVDTDALGAFVDQAADQPETVQLGLEASSTYEGTAVHSLGKIDGYTLGGERIERDDRAYTIPYGAWREVLEAAGWVGATDRVEPVEVALSALASCINVGISLNAVANGVDLDALETTVAVDFDPGVLFSLQDLGEAEGVFEHLTAEVAVEGDDLDPDQIDEWARRAPFYTLVSLAQDVHLTVNTPAEVRAD